MRMQPQLIKEDENGFISSERREDIPARSIMSPLINAALALVILVVYLAISTTRQKYGQWPPTCHRKDLDVLSCTPAADMTNSCCVENPGGLILATQLYNPNVGPDDSWTIHGLWGDFCNGSYPASCDLARAYTDIPSILEAFNERELLAYMTDLWLNYPSVTTENGTDADLWAHEWSKHGTCMSTLRPKCYDDYTQAQEIIDYYTTAFRMYRALPTFQFLETCNIVPSNEKTYELVAVEKCLDDATGARPHVGCSTIGELDEVWYYHYWLGRIRNGVGHATDSTFPSTCPSSGIRYVPRAAR